MNDVPVKLLEQAASGDMAAFEEIYKATSGFVYNVALRIARNDAVAQEIAQDVFMKIHGNLKNFAFRSAFRTWVYRITVNTSINYCRKSSREQKSRVDYDSVIEYVPDSSPGPQERIGSGEDREKLYQLLDKLSLDHKACLILREIQGLSYQEMSRALNIPVNTVRTRLKRARQALMDLAGKEQR